MSVRLGELLTKASLISQDQLKEALRVQKETGGKLGETLIKLGFVSEEDITECLSQQFGVPSINLQHFEIDAGVIKLIPGDVARKYNILPVNKTGATITIAMADPTNVFAMDDIKFMTGYNVEPVVASELGITEPQLQDALSKISFLGLVALDEILAVGGDRGESVTLGDTLADSSDGPLQAYEVEEMRRILADAISRMPERERMVLTLYYYEGLTLAEIGKVLGVTESRVCQIHTKSVIQLRSRILASEREPA